MDKIKVIYDSGSHTLTIWLDDPSRETVCEETVDEVILMKDSANRVIGLEVLHFEPSNGARGLEVETFVLGAS